jgi:ABC-type multidrug transport system fused ATPase/permease subunit
MKFIKGFSLDSKSAYEKAGNVSTEAVSQIRTVASFTNEETLFQMYSAKLEDPMRLGVRKAHVSGVGFGASQLVMFVTNCIAFWYGGYLVQHNEWHVSQATIDATCPLGIIFIILLFYSFILFYFHILFRILFRILFLFN